MTLTVDDIHGLFKSYESGEGGSVSGPLSEPIDWIVREPHPLAGHFRSKDNSLAGALAKQNKVLYQRAQLKAGHVLVSGNQAVIGGRHSRATARTVFVSATGTADSIGLLAARSFRFAPILILLLLAELSKNSI
ncbi:hypothetical protein HNQ77_004755 [Silvibacterium bohemicum]|uniref:Uncharacterized protein n=1 Tax=Silvibacterium bohemicum TaxID=1577686 RepID=A0A841K910_9BACT|nr:hypothetical protein [Silvibacterium bohemicum]